MLLNRTFYSALENTLGPGYVSDDPAILKSYANPFRTGVPHPPTFDAITLPKSTEEVQAIVKLCNQFKVRFKASSTGWKYCDPPSSDSNCVKIDLRRMNRIVEINEKSMYAVVEPYVVGAQLQAELMKRGLNCNLNGAGGNCSALPLAGHCNLGHLSQSGSYGERNQLALEWVTGDGEIVRLGSLGVLDEWFCADGPGPSLRGLIRGDTTPLGGLGVYTKAAQKIYHWPGPHTFPMEGMSPKYKPAYIPENFLLRYYSFKDFATLIDAVLKVGEAEIATELMCFNSAMMSANLATKHVEEQLILHKKFAQSVQGPGFMILIAGNSKADFEYKKRVMYRIIEETSGKSLEYAEDPDNEGGYIWRFFRETGSIKETGRMLSPSSSAGPNSMVGGTDGLLTISNFIRRCSEFKEKLIKEGRLFDNGSEPFMQTLENGHLAHAEVLSRVSLSQVGDDLKRTRMELQNEGNRVSIEEHFGGMPQHLCGDDMHDMFGPHAANYHLWLRKIKRTFDPNGASEASLHITAKD